jgi:carotenoid cleavage dioxygenase
VPDEAVVTALEVEGALPPELTGTYVRNGSNPVTGRGEHWFVGDGMLHAVHLEGGRATWYRNRWVQTALLGKGLTGAGAPGGANSTSNTTAFSYGGRLLSLQEIGFPYEVALPELTTVGPFDFGGSLTSAMTAHPKVDPATGRLHSFGYGFVAPFLTSWSADATGPLARREVVDIPRSTMMHDFAITDRDVVFWDLPVVFSLETAVERPGEMPFAWDPSAGARIGVMPLDGPASAVRWVEVEPCYVFHGVNAWREGADVVLDVCRLPSAFAPGGDPVGAGSVRRWRIGTAAAQLTFAEDIVLDRPWDLARVAPAETGRAHRRGYFVTTRVVEGGWEFAGVASIDRASGRTDEWDPGFGQAAGEALPVGDWVLTFVYDRPSDTSHLAVLAADDLAAGPVARVHLGRRVPFGFHATWVAG